MNTYTEFFWDTLQDAAIAHRTDGHNHVTAFMPTVIPAKYVGDVLSNMRELLVAYKMGMSW